MKRILLSAIFVFAAVLCGWSQSIVCESPCPAVTNQPMNEATFPYYAPEALSYNLNTEVDVCITFLCPETTNVNVSAPLVGNVNTNATIDTLIISALSNLPEGLTYCISTAEIYSGDYCTVHITGTPIEAGEYDINVTGAFSGSASIPWMGGIEIPIPISNRTLTIASGIVIEIIDPAALAASFTASSRTVAPGGTITYTNTSRNAESVQWLFEGGSPANSTSMTTVDVVYANTGSYSVSLIATRGEETDTTEMTINVQVPIEVNFKTHDTLVYVGDTVHFDNLSTGGYYYKWNFDVDDTYGLGEEGSIMGSFLNSSSEENPSYVYSQEGYFSVSLTVSYDQNFFGDLVDGVTLVKRNYVHVIANPNVVMTADFEPSTYNAAVNEVISFNNLSEGYASFIWDFGDSVEGETEEESQEGGHSEEVSPQYAYSAAGVYEVTMMAYNDYNQLISGNYPTITKSITVEDRPVAVEENAINGISVYPNPATTTINVAAEGMQNITIIDMTGRVVMSKDVSSNVETIDVAGFAKANYMVRIATSSDVIVRSIVVE